MSLPIRRFVSSVGLLFSCAALLARGQDQDSTVAQAVKPFLEKNKHAAVAVGIVTPQGKRSFGFGTAKLDGKDQQPDEQTLYEIGSITKVFGGTLLAQLVLEKKIRLDDPVQRWLPAEWTLPRRDERDISFLHLATHTSSLPVQPPLLALAAMINGTVADPYAKFDSRAVAKTLGTTRLAQPIGSKYDYSNLGIGLLGHALARVERADSYEDLVAKRIFRPLGMESSAIKLSEEQTKRLAPGHDKFGKPASGWNFATLEACGGIRSNVRDMLRFLEAAMGKTDTPLKPAFALAQQPWRELPGKNLEIGLCWIRSGPSQDAVIWHNGGTGGYASFMGFRPQTGIGVIVLSNGSERVDELGSAILKLLEN